MNLFKNFFKKAKEVFTGNIKKVVTRHIEVDEPEEKKPKLRRGNMRKSTNGRVNQYIPYVDKYGVSRTKLIKHMGA